MYGLFDKCCIFIGLRVGYIMWDTIASMYMYRAEAIDKYKMYDMVQMLKNVILRLSSVFLLLLFYRISGVVVSMFTSNEVDQALVGLNLVYYMLLFR